jgi:hypothetical protein
MGQEVESTKGAPMSEPDLARFVRPNLTEARIAWLWGRVDARSRPSRMRRRLLPAVAVAACCAGLLVAMTRGRSKQPPNSMEGAVVESGAITLADGSRVVLADGGRVRIVTVREDTVELALEVGAIDLAVMHSRRLLVVHTPRYDIVDLGTRFRVMLDAQGGTHVDVSEGTVEVRCRDGSERTRLLGAGESWSNAQTSVVASAVAVVREAPRPVSETPAAAPIVRESSPGPKELLETAESARLAGQLRSAAEAFDTLRHRFRADSRAALAAFELGRLRLDSLDDAPGAVDALNDAIRLSPRGPLREDAEARRVEALAAERSPDCSAARDAFLARYPHSAHASGVAGRCVLE